LIYLNQLDMFSYYKVFPGLLLLNQLL